MAGFGVKRLINEINGKWLILFLFFEIVFLAGKNYQGESNHQEYVKTPAMERFQYESIQENQRRPITTTDKVERQSNFTDVINAKNTKEKLPNRRTENLKEEHPEKSDVKLPECNIDLCPRRFPKPERKPLRITSDILPSIEYIPSGSDLLICESYKKLSSDDARQFCNELEKFPTEHNLTSYWSLCKDDRFRLSSLILTNMGYKQRVPNTIGLGVKKCGSCAMLKLLGLHPQIYSCHGEGAFFGKEERYPRGLDFYRHRSLFTKEGSITFEKTPAYFEIDEVPSQMKQSLPESTKFYFSVRDPVERTISDFHHVRNGEVRRASIKPVVTPESEGELFVDGIFDESGNIKSDNPVVDGSYYARHFKLFLEHFPLSSFHIADAADIRDKPIDVLQRVEHFLEVDAFFKNDMLVDSPSSDFGTCVHINGQDECTRISGTNHPKPYVNETIVKKLRDYFRPLNEEFEEITGQKFSWTHL